MVAVVVPIGNGKTHGVDAGAQHGTSEVDNFLRVAHAELDAHRLAATQLA